MCIITGKVDSVHSTKIFTMPSKDKHRQLTVYSNSVSVPSKTLMILPVPYANSIKFEDSVIHYSTLFTDISKSFRRTQLYSLSANRSAETNIKVYDVGSYNVSIANSIQDILNLDRTYFANPQEIFDLLHDDYIYPFGFLVCTLKQGETQYKPLAYSHTLWKDQLFVPTRHYHPEDRQGNHLQSFTHDWDHEIFSLAVPFTTDTHAPTDYMPLSQNHLDWNIFSPEFQWGNDIPLRRLEIKGGYKNIDITFPLYSFSAAPYTPSFLGMKRGLKKFFNK